MYKNYSREALIELVQHQQKLLDYKSEPFLTRPPTILCQQDISKADCFLDMFSKTLKAAKDFEKEIDISAWLSKKDYYNISDADLFYHLASANHPAFDKAANNILLPYINKANTDNESYADILDFFDTCLAQNFIGESVITLLLANIKQLKNRKECAFFEKHLRDSIIRSPHHYIFVKVNQNNHDILNLKQHPESLVFFNFTRNIINGFIEDFRRSSIRNRNDIIDAVVKTGVFDDDIFNAYHHKNTLMDGKVISTFKKSLSLRNNPNDENIIALDSALLERLELITRDQRAQ